MSAKLKDVAEMVNLSTTTVSLVLNNKDVRVSSETRKKIFKVAEQLDYRPNRMAVGLVTKRSRNIGLIVPDIENAFFAELAKHVGNYLRGRGYNVLLCNTNRSTQADIMFLRMFREAAVDGVVGVFSDSENEDYIKELEGLMKDKIAVVMMDKIVSKLKTPCVGTDNFYGGYIATKYLIDCGHKKIAFISGPQDTVSGRDRMEGAKKALAESGIELDEECVYYGDYQYEFGYESGKDILRRGKATAIFAGNDMMAYGVYKATKEANVVVGKDISVIGFDDLWFSSLLDVPLTSIKQNVKEIAERASDIILNIIDGNEIAQKDNYLTQPELVERESVAKIGEDKRK